MTTTNALTETLAPPIVFDPWTFPVDGWSAVEASAGTGKTYNIVSVVVRLMTEGIPLSQTLVVTFTNAATSELRLRIRKGIVQARELLLTVWRTRQFVQGTPEQQQFARLLESLTSQEAPDFDRVQLAIERLGQALQEIDTAPIMTIHSFASRSLREDALRAGTEFDLEVTTDLSRYVERISNDWMADIVVLPDSPARDWLLEQEDAEDIIRAAARAGTASMPAVYGDLTIPETLEALVRETDFALPTILQDAVAWHRGWLAWRAGQGVGAEGIPTLSVKDNGRENQAKYPVLLAPDPTPMEESVDGLMALFGALMALRDVLEDGNVNPWFTTTKANKAAMCQRLQSFVDAAEPLMFAWDCLIARLHGFLKRRTQAHLAIMTLRDGKIHTDAAVAQLSATLSSPRGVSLLEQLQKTYRVALIDEFQDTDAAQWQIFSAIFRPKTHSLLLIGDPKQAIYSFRGADIRTYLFAVNHQETRRYTFDVNYRSSAAVIDSLNALLSEQPALPSHREWFEPEQGVRYQRVKAHGAANSTLVGHGGVTLRWLPTRSLSQVGVRPSTGLSDHVIKAVCRDILYMLNEGVMLEGTGEQSSERRVRAGDLAILCRGNREVKRFSELLRQQGVPVVSSSDDDLFASDEGGELLQVMHALHGSGIDSAAMRFRLGALWREDGSEGVPPGTDETPLQRLAREREMVARCIRELQARMRNEGMSVVLRQVVEGAATHGTLSLRHDAERALVNYLHLLEQLEVLRVREHLDDLRLVHRFEESRSASRSGQDENPVAPRLERESNAVRVMTYHKSKGLEFGVVILPLHVMQKASRPKFRPGVADASHGAGTERNMEFWTHPGLSSRVSEVAAPIMKQRGDDAMADARRLDYVALTRAKSNVLIYMVPYTSSGKPGADLRLLQRCPGFAELWEPIKKQAGDPDVWDQLGTEMAEASGKDEWPVSVLVANGALEHRRYVENAFADRFFSGARHTRSSMSNIARLWTQPSYSSLVSGLKQRDTRAGIQRDSFRAVDESHGLVTLEVDADQAAEAPESPPGRDQDADLPTIVVVNSPVEGGALDDAWESSGDSSSEASAVHDGTRGLRGFMRGIEAGHALHGWFEDADFAWARTPETWRAHRNQATELLLHHMDRARIRWPKTVITPEQRTGYAAEVCDDLYRVLQTRLTPMTATGALDSERGVPRLCDLSMSDRMDELEFFLRAGSGMESDSESGEEGSSGWVGTDWLSVLAERATPDVRMSEAYRSKLRNAVTDRAFRGFLNGKIDLVFRWQRRWYIADYKSNFIAASAEESQVSAPPSGYSCSAICAEMEHHHYYLQYHLYVLALHRFLERRLPDYDYERDMGGVYYLFVRGMTDDRYAVTPVAGEGPALEYGVFYDRPSLSVVEGLDTAFRGATRQEVA